MYTVAMDMDGVVYPFEDAFNALYTALGGEYQDFSSWIDFGTLPREKITQVWNDPRLFNSKPAYPGAVDAIAEILTMPDVQMFFATSFGRRAESGIIMSSKVAWLTKQWPDFDLMNFIAIHRKWLLGTDMIVDDFPDHVRKWMNAHPDGTGVLVRRPWNGSDLLKLHRKGAIIVDNVEEVVPLIQERARAKEA